MDFVLSIYEGVSTSAFRNVVMIPLNLNGIMAIFWKAEVDSPTYEVSIQSKVRHEQRSCSQTGMRLRCQ